MRTGIVKDRRFADHDTGPYHVEGPGRIEVVNRMVEEEFASPYLLIEPRPALVEELELIHTPAHVRFLAETSGRPPVAIDPDTSTSAATYDTALLAAGGTLKALDLIMDGRIRNAFALVRPPGHHAEASRAMGFCYFNNTAIAAEYLVRRHGCRRILVVDWDVHHGNGTQKAFYARNDVLFFSIHQDGLFPGTGREEESGEGPGTGYSLNFPLKPGKGDEDYLYLFQRILAPVAAQYKPEFILVSAGFDIAEDDPLGGMKVRGQGFAGMAAELLAMADATAQGRILFILEGGYSLLSLKEGVKGILRKLAEDPGPPLPRAAASDALRRDIGPALKAVKKHWKL
jgi:acetoin utilization deacetylase AcuC-like enzyme